MRVDRNSSSTTAETIWATIVIEIRVCAKHLPLMVSNPEPNPKLPLDPSVGAFYLDLFQEPCLL